MNALENLKKELKADGWKFQRPPMANTGVEWAAYKQLPGTIDCHENDKPAQLWLEPWKIELPEYNDESITIEVAGALDENQWFEFKAYSIPVDKVMTRLPMIARMLAASWNAAHESWGG